MTRKQLRESVERYLQDSKNDRWKDDEINAVMDLLVDEHYDADAARRTSEALDAYFVQTNSNEAAARLYDQNMDRVGYSKLSDDEFEIAKKQKNPLVRKVEGIKVDKDVSSLIFLHACAKPARNMMSGTTSQG